MVLVLSASLCSPAFAAKYIAYASTQSILIDGKPVTVQAYALKDSKGNLTNYVKLRDIGYLLDGTRAQFDVGWDEYVTITTGESYTSISNEMKTPYSGNRPYKIATGKTLIDGKLKKMDAILLNDSNGGGYTYYKLRDLGEALGFTVGWSRQKGVYIETGSSSTGSSSSSGKTANVLLPDLTAFYKKNPHIDKAYQGGHRVQYTNMPLSSLNAVTRETLSLLQESRYQLKLVSTDDNGRGTVRYNFAYTGSASMKMISDKSGNNTFHVQFTVYEKDDYFATQLHYCNDFKVTNCGKTVSVSTGASGSGGSGSSSSGGGSGSNLPDHSKLQCLTCDGDGDCNSCGGKGYKIRDGIKSDCTRCTSGNCPSCGGSGTR